MPARKRSGSPPARRRRAFYRFMRHRPAEMAETAGTKETNGRGAPQAGETGRCVRNGMPAASRAAGTRRHATETQRPHAARMRCRRRARTNARVPPVRTQDQATACGGHSSVQAAAGIGLSCAEAVPSATVISRCRGDCGFCVKECKTPSRKPASLSRIDTPLIHTPADHCRRGGVAVRAGQAVNGGQGRCAFGQPWPVRHGRSGTADCDCPMRVRP